MSVMARTNAATVYDYLDWRGDLSLKESAFCEVDNVILSLISYVDLEGILKEGERIALTLACRRYFQMHTYEEVQARNSFLKKTPFLMEKAASTARFGGIALHDYINHIDYEAAEQMSAVTFDLPDGTSYVAFRGTDSSLAGWKEDFAFAYLSKTRGQQDAVEYLKKIADQSEKLLRVGGHSKGGNLAVYAAAFCGDAVQKRILEVDTNDGPGFRKEVADSPEISQIRSRIRSIVPDESVFGLLLYGPDIHEVVKSSAMGIMQHDPQS